MKQYDRNFYSEDYIIEREVSRRMYKLDRERSQKFRNKVIKIGKGAAIVGMTLAIGATIFITVGALKQRFETQEYLDSLKQDTSYSETVEDHRKWDEKPIWELIEEIKQDYEADHQQETSKQR